MNLCTITLLQDNQTQSAEELTTVLEKGRANGGAPYALITDTEVAIREVEEKLRGLRKEPRLHTLSLTYILSRYDIRIEPAVLCAEVGKESYDTIKALYAMHFLGYESYYMMNINAHAEPNTIMKQNENCARYLGSPMPEGALLYDTTHMSSYRQRIVKALFAKCGNEPYISIRRYAAKQKRQPDKELPLRLLYTMFISHDPKRYGYTC